MFSRRSATQDRLQEVIDVLLDDLANGYDTEEFHKKMLHLKDLYKLKEQTAPKRISPDTMLIVAGNLAGIMIIIGYERVHIISSKALGFVMRLR